MANLSGTNLSGLLDAAPDAIVAVNAAGRIVLVNAQAERLFGCDRGELVGASVDMLVPDSAREVHPAHRSQYLDSPQPRPMGAGMELAGRRRDGKEFPAEISLSAFETEEGTLVAAAIRDASERKRADAKFRGLLEAAHDAVVCVDESGRIALVNAQAERLFGYARDELVGNSVDMLVPDGSRPGHAAHRAHYLADSQPRPMGAGVELAGRRRDGTEFPAEISLSAFETEDGVLVSAAIRDVTERLEAQAERHRLIAEAEREKLEAQLHQSQRLESLGQLAGGVAHDFNNLLGVILSYSSLISAEIETAAETDPARWDVSQKDVHEIQLAAERAARLTHQLLAFARREIVRPQVLDVNDVVQNLEHLLRRTLGEHVVLTTNLAPSLRQVMADPGHIEQVLVNLAVNARDAMLGGGTLSIETANIAVGADYVGDAHELPPGDYVRVRVSDTGVGMSSAVAERAFEPFFTTKDKGEGSGLGLATVYGIVTQAGGNAYIYSAPNLGTTLTILLPASDETPARVESRSPASTRPAIETILVVEDEDALREATRRLLSRSGYDVITAEDGPSAIVIARTHAGPIDLLLTDVVMPRMLGVEVARQTVELRPDIRVVFMSGYAQPVIGAHGRLEAGVTLLEKPFSAATLLATVREMLDRDD